jgi:hypothetical protein
MSRDDPIPPDYPLTYTVAAFDNDGEPLVINERFDGRLCRPSAVRAESRSPYRRGRVMPRTTEPGRALPSSAAQSPPCIAVPCVAVLYRADLRRAKRRRKSSCCTRFRLARGCATHDLQRGITMSCSSRDPTWRQSEASEKSAFTRVNSTQTLRLAT